MKRKVTKGMTWGGFRVVTKGSFLENSLSNTENTIPTQFTLFSLLPFIASFASLREKTANNCQNFTTRRIFLQHHVVDLGAMAIWRINQAIINAPTMNSTRKTINGEV